MVVLIFINLLNFRSESACCVDMHDACWIFPVFCGPAVLLAVFHILPCLSARHCAYQHHRWGQSTVISRPGHTLSASLYTLTGLVAVRLFTCMFARLCIWVYAVTLCDLVFQDVGLCCSCCGPCLAWRAKSAVMVFMLLFWLLQLRRLLKNPQTLHTIQQPPQHL